jgi:hypothetical protein
LERLPVAAGGLVVEVFPTGASRRPRRPGRGGAARQRRDLGVRSALACCFTVDGGPAGVAQAVSTRRSRFSPAHLVFLEAVSRWVGLIARRGALVEQFGQDARAEGRREGAAAVRRLTPREREVAALVT